MTDADEMLDDCNKRYHKLNEWESKFIDSLLDIKDLSYISDKQYETLEKIWEKIT
jgi:hypothetical protein